MAYAGTSGVTRDQLGALLGYPNDDDCGSLSESKGVFPDREPVSTCATALSHAPGGFYGAGLIA